MVYKYEYKFDNEGEGGLQMTPDVTRVPGHVSVWLEAWQASLRIVTVAKVGLDAGRSREGLNEGST